MEATNYLGSFPDELWVSCFNHLSPKELGTCSQVSKQLQACSEDNFIWRRLFREKYPDSYKSLVEHQPKVETKKNKAKFRRLSSASWKTLYRTYELGYSKEGMRCLVENAALNCFTIFKNVIYAADLTGTLYCGKAKQKLSKKGDCNFHISYLAIDEDQTGDRRIVAGGSNGCIKVFNSNLQLLGELTIAGKKRVHGGQISRIEVTATDIITTSYYFNSTVHVWDRNNYTLKKTLEAGPCQALAVSRNKIVTGNSKGTVLIWDAETYEILHKEQPKQPCPIKSIKIFDNKIFCNIPDIHSSNPDAPSLFVWDLETYKLIKTVNYLRENVLFTLFDNQFFYIKNPEGFATKKKVNILNERILSNNTVGHDESAKTIELPPESAITSFEAGFRGLVFMLRPATESQKFQAGLYLAPAPSLPAKPVDNRI